jgi:predicted aspartyl protease
MDGVRVDIEIENPARPGAKSRLHGVLVDTGSELTWVPATELEAIGVQRRKLTRFRQATGTIVERWTGAGMVYAGGTSTADDIVFGHPGDLVLLGARTLEGLNLRVDPVTKQLVDAGPAPAALSLAESGR